MHNRIKDIYALFAALALLAVLFLSPDARADGHAGVSAVSPENAWRFRVFLDDREIGYHHFYLAGEGEHRQLRSEARFEVKLLFVKVFDYEHENLETWSGNCLQSIRSRTDSNGDLYSVNGRRADDAFRVVANEGAAALPECVMTFAYWNPAILDADRLLNSQTGQLAEVTVRAHGPETLDIGPHRVPAEKYTIESTEGPIRLWYAPGSRHWLALEAELESGRTLRYVPLVLPWNAVGETRLALN